MTVALVRHPAPIQQLCICLFSPPQAWSTISRRPPTDVFDMVPFSSGSPMARKPAINGSSPPPPSFSPPPPPPHVFLKERGDYSAALCSFLHYVVMKLVDKLLYWYLCNCIQVVQLTIAHIQYADSTPVFPLSAVYFPSLPHPSISPLQQEQIFWGRSLLTRSSATHPFLLTSNLNWMKCRCVHSTVGTAVFLERVFVMLIFTLRGILPIMSKYTGIMCSVIGVSNSIASKQI